MSDGISCSMPHFIHSSYKSMKNYIQVDKAFSSIIYMILHSQRFSVC